MSRRRSRLRSISLNASQEHEVHFCGEHTSQDFQGYLNGAVETGARAASEILADYKAGLTP